MAFAGIAVGALFALASAHYWHQWWFVFLVVLFGVVAVAGLWIVLAGALPWLPPKRWTHIQPELEPPNSPREIASVGKRLVSITGDENTELVGGAREVHTRTNPDGSESEYMGLLEIGYLGPSRKYPKPEESDPKEG